MTRQPRAPDARSPKQSHFQQASRGDGKKERTRALLLDTAIAVFARKGIETASVVEITAAAGLSNGSFYYHFPDKDSLVEAVGGAVAATLVREVDEAMTAIANGAERVAFGTVLFIHRGVADPSWGRLIVHALASLGEFHEQISAGIRKDVQIGIEQGHFEIEPSSVLYGMLLGIVSAAMREQLERGTEGVDRLAAQAILGVLGVRPSSARRLAERAVARLAFAG